MVQRFVLPELPIGSFFSRRMAAGDLGGGHDRTRRADCMQSQHGLNSMAGT